VCCSGNLRGHVLPVVARVFLEEFTACVWVSSVVVWDGVRFVGLEDESGVSCLVCFCVSRLVVYGGGDWVQPCEQFVSFAQVAGV